MTQRKPHRNRASTSTLAAKNTKTRAAPPTPEPPAARIGDEARSTHLRWLHELTQIPTAAGREQRVVRWIKAWAKARRDIRLTEDPCGNLHLRFKDDTGDTAGRTPRKAGKSPPRPLYFTAHLDHPAFVIERVIAPTVFELSFRGGVMADYFMNTKVTLFDENDQTFTGTITSLVEGSGKPFKHYICELDDEQPSDTGDEADPTSLNIGDVAVWRLARAEIADGLFHTLACDDLAAAAAALSAFDVLREMRRGTRNRDPEPRQPVRLLFTRAEEIGFVGAIGATRAATGGASPRSRSRRANTREALPPDARIIALENSRSFADSPVGGGPIVRVGDRISVFSPSLTDAIARRAEQIAGGPATVTASQKLSDAPQWKWQRKLMAGGACEASVFCQAGFEATCVCLPLGNYHNMGDLANVQAGTNGSPPKIEREFIAVSDYEGLVDLLVACGLRLPEGNSLGERFERLWKDLSFVL